MTHDELLAKIDYWFDTDNFHLHKNALRAVVELHKPTDPKKISYVSYIEVNKMCSQCRVFYACPTIQTIEKELQ